MGFRRMSEEENAVNDYEITVNHHIHQVIFSISYPSIYLTCVHAEHNSVLGPILMVLVQ